jgi:hypothetical protein
VIGAPSARSRIPLSAFVGIVDKRFTSRLQKTTQVPEIREHLGFAQGRTRC